MTHRNDARWMKGGQWWRIWGRRSTDGQLNYTVQLSLTNGVEQTALVSHFKAWLKALQCYQCVPYIFRRKSKHHCASQSPCSLLTKKPILKQYIQSWNTAATVSKKQRLPLIFCISVIDLLPPLYIFSHSQRAHFVFSPIRIHQRSILIQNPREH